MPPLRFSISALRSGLRGAGLAGKRPPSLVASAGLAPEAILGDMALVFRTAGTSVASSARSVAPEVLTQACSKELNTPIAMSINSTPARRSMLGR